MPSHPVALPEGWSYPDRGNGLNLHAELMRELPPGHVLTGREVETFATCRREPDDVLFRHKDEPDRFTVIHLSWRGRTEVDASFPLVTFDGTFEEFLADERKHQAFSHFEDS